MGNLIYEFNEKIREDLSSEESFDIDDGLRYYHFVRGTIGKAVYVYGCYSYFVKTTSSKGRGFSSSLDDGKMEIVAIVSGEMIYVVNQYFFGSYKCQDYPEGMQILDDLLREWNLRIKEVYYPEFYKGLGPIEVMSDGAVDRCCKEARKQLLVPGVLAGVSEDVPFKLKMDDLTDYLCGYVDIEEIIHEMMNAESDTLRIVKGRKEFVEKLVEAQTGAEPWEIALVEAVNRSGLCGAKSLTVEFVYNGRTASAKMEISRLVSRLVNGQSFDECDFVNKKEGKRLLMVLGAPRYGDQALRCGDVNRILYRGKVIYSVGGV